MIFNSTNSDFTKSHYSNYLKLPLLLSCQKPLTSSQDEDFFISVHQICELAFQQMISDMKRVLDAIAIALKDETDPLIGDTSEACYFFDRSLQFYEVVLNTMLTLRTMRGFAEFRQHLGSMSGFQSIQFRHLEIMSGVARYWGSGIQDLESASNRVTTELDRHNDSLLNTWLHHHYHHNLVYYYRILLGRVPESLQSEKLERLSQHIYAFNLLKRMRTYEVRQNQFHQEHLELATQQLKKIGIARGTGGTCYQKYLSQYSNQYEKLFDGLTDFFNKNSK